MSNPMEDDPDLAYEAQLMYEYTVDNYSGAKKNKKNYKKNYKKN